MSLLIGNFYFLGGKGLEVLLLQGGNCQAVGTEGALHGLWCRV